MDWIMICADYTLLDQMPSLLPSKLYIYVDDYCDAFRCQSSYTSVSLTFYGLSMFAQVHRPPSSVFQTTVVRETIVGNWTIENWRIVVNDSRKLTDSSEPIHPSFSANLVASSRPRSSTLQRTHRNHHTGLRWSRPFKFSLPLLIPT